MKCPQDKNNTEKCLNCPNPYHKRIHALASGFSDSCTDNRGGCPKCLPFDRRSKPRGNSLEDLNRLYIHSYVDFVDGKVVMLKEGKNMYEFLYKIEVPKLPNYITNYQWLAPLPQGILEFKYTTPDGCTEYVDAVFKNGDEIWLQLKKEGGYLYYNKKDEPAVPILTQCCKGHTLPLGVTACELNICRDFYPDENNQCVNLKPYEKTTREK